MTHDFNRVRKVLPVEDETKSEWSALREEILDTPELHREYQRTRQSMVQIRRLLQQVDAERERAGLSKAALAERIGAEPSVVRRLFSSGTSNPTLKTILDITDVLGMQVELRPPHRSHPLTHRKAGPATAA